eukprot:6066416-Prymnesium_polylepis.1
MPGVGLSVRDRVILILILHVSACRTAVDVPQMTHGGGSLAQRALAVKALMPRRSIVRARQAARAAQFE